MALLPQSTASQSMSVAGEDTSRPELCSVSASEDIFAREPRFHPEVSWDIGPGTTTAREQPAREVGIHKKRVQSPDVVLVICLVEGPWKE